MDQSYTEKENRRLRALEAFDILDSRPEDSFDLITSLAARCCGTDTALVTFVDRDRQWFKSKIGIDAGETSREVSFCSHTIQQEQVMVIEDASTHPEFKDNPLVTGEPYIRFYAGAPLVDQEGNGLGSVCVIAPEPRSLTPGQEQSLVELANITMQLLETRKVARELAEVSSELKTLRSMIPICANCKSIRNDADEWKRVEHYFQEHTGASFSHGICPDCQKKLYPEINTKS
jgi:GAF domain-containing protein